MSRRMPKVPADFPVRPLKAGEPATDRVTCGTCGRSWDDAIATDMTPAPGARCPFEYFHPSESPAERRAERLMPNGIPRWVRCYDTGPDDFDRYTVVFTKAGTWGGDAYNGLRYYLGMSAHPFHPQGIGQHGCVPAPGRFGKRIPFSALPPDCQRLVLSDYRKIWGLA